MATSLGFIQYQGIWSSTSTYTFLLNQLQPSVTYKGLTYVAVSTPTTGMTPNTDIAWVVYNTLPSANIFVGNASGLATNVTISNDATLDNVGALTVGVNKITNAKLTQMPPLTVKGNNTNAINNAIDLTVPQTLDMLKLNSTSTPTFAQVNITGPIVNSNDVATKSYVDSSTGSVFTAPLLQNLSSGTVVRLSNSGVTKINSPVFSGYGASIANSTNAASYSAITTLAGNKILVATKVQGGGQYSAYSFDGNAFTLLVTQPEPFTSFFGEGVANSSLYGSTTNDYAVFALYQGIQAVRVDSANVMTRGAVFLIGEDHTGIVEIAVNKYIVVNGATGLPCQIITVNPVNLAITAIGAIQNLAINSSGGQNYSICSTGVMNQFLLTYFDTTSLQSKLVVGIVSDSTITFGNSLTLPNVTQTQRIAYLSVNTMIWSYVSGNNGYCVVINTNNYAIPNVYTVYQIGAIPVKSLTISAYSSTSALVLTNTGTSTITGYNVSLNSPTDLKLSSTGINLTTNSNLNIYDVNRITSSNLQSDDSSVPIIVYDDLSNISNVTCGVYSASDYSLAVGILEETGVVGETKKIALLNQISNSYSGLSIGDIYYIQTNSNLGLGITLYPFGRAITSNKINLTRKP